MDPVSKSNQMKPFYKTWHPPLWFASFFSHSPQDPIIVPQSTTTICVGHQHRRTVGRYSCAQKRKEPYQQVSAPSTHCQAYCFTQFSAYAFRNCMNNGKWDHNNRSELVEKGFTYFKDCYVSGVRDLLEMCEVIEESGGPTCSQVLFIFVFFIYVCWVTNLCSKRIPHNVAL